jgi:hypothetical protein
MLEEMRPIYEAELERHLQHLTKAEAKAVVDALQKVTTSTCSSVKAEANAMVRRVPPVPVPTSSGLPLVGAGGVVRRGRTS